MLVLSSSKQAAIIADGGTWSAENAGIPGSRCAGMHINPKHIEQPHGTSPLLQTFL